MVPRRSYPKPTGPMDQWLESQGYYRKHTARDGSCLFRAVSEQVFYVQAVHQNVRRQCVEFIQENKLKFQEFLKEPLEDYVVRMLDSREWGGQMEINAMALLYHHDVLVFEEVGKSPAVATNYGFAKKILLCLSSDNHYDSVYPKLFIMKAAFCQSLVYEVLYKNVFQLPDVNYAVNKMLHDKTNRVQKERVMNEDRFISCGSFGFSMEISLESNKEYKDHEDTNVNVKELLAQGATPFPYKVAKALDPNIYRNIEFDIWNDFRKEMKFGWYRNNGELQVGVKCLVKLNPDRSFHAHIQEMSPDRGPVIVFVEELGENMDSVHVSTESDKTGFHVSGGGNESVTWQAKQVDMEVSNALQKAFNGEIVSRSNKNPSDDRENRIQNSHVGRPRQNSARHSEPFEAHVTPQQSEDSEVSCGHTIGSPAQSSPPAVLNTSYNIPPPTAPCAFTPMPPTVYYHTMVPFYFPMDSEQGMMLVPYYPQYSVSSPVQLEPQDTVEVSTAVPDVQAVPSHFTGAIYSPVKQSGNIENGCLPPYTIYPQPPTPVLYQQTSSVPAGVYPTSAGPEANISVPRWMQTMPGLPHMNPTPCMLQSPPTTPVGAPVPYNTVT